MMKNYHFRGKLIQGKLCIGSCYVGNEGTIIIFCSQYSESEWYDQLGDSASPLADATLDRIVHDAYKINIESIDLAKDMSMREVYGLDKALSK
ncbi:ATP-binding protein [Sporomusa ovata]|nr:ATP-binding protein [Sporomusa ovata]